MDKKEKFAFFIVALVMIGMLVSTFCVLVGRSGAEMLGMTFESFKLLAQVSMLSMPIGIAILFVFCN